MATGPRAQGRGRDPPFARKCGDGDLSKASEDQIVRPCALVALSLRAACVGATLPSPHRNPSRQLGTRAASPGPSGTRLSWCRTRWLSSRAPPRSPPLSDTERSRAHLVSPLPGHLRQRPKEASTGSVSGDVRLRRVTVAQDRRTRRTISRGPTMGSPGTVTLSKCRSRVTKASAFSALASATR